MLRQLHILAHLVQHDAYAFRMMGLFRQSGLNFVSCPTENLYLQGRQDSYPKEEV